ncbi:succinyl-diaminopimelate desuccinylase [Methylorubrum extorquens]|uniref:Succinyl-diaminopimelate desuccinylase n=2 Tax=Methylorubrum extorquens TaxID=408 RepID=C5B039_METEA|nr:succinyl-diaminopimelate desuccinylase [Methylorubrum extorquens]ACS39389.1 N-succinyl-diaminopimelate deacylase (dapE) [Methylorubrum extorquens AM1]APX87725.1 succinyl-diaminopimelate desuccinylase [Methylorubrum extorquens]EHP92677.1 Succinyl-diaminopimelate desuccinylase [Methylorubrum extorquens DSM 13060]MCP1542505.1 succinyl-diaminopimelate desuccinylase [Methylorubrum extorquens]MCP1590150.1 succinyl-diaminopimelate desuccinylase [Methylorubrum extorquens]
MPPLSDHSPLALAQALIRCPSVTPEEGGALSFLADRLSRAGFSVERPVFSEPGTPDIQNLYARIGTAGPVLVFAGHTDVVPPGETEAWTHGPFSGEVADGFLYGRGAVDMKGGIACMLAATLAFLDRHGPDFGGSIAFLVTGDEEGPAVNGTVKLLDWAKARGERFDHCLLGEPTNPDTLGEMIKIGRRGSLTGRITVHGRQGHVAYPHRAENPIPGLLRLASALTADPLDGGTAHFDASNLEFTTIDVGNPATNVIPASAKAVFNVRFNDDWTADTLGAEIRRRLEAAAGNAVRFSLDLQPSNSPAFLTQPDAFVDRVADAIEAETGRRPALSTTGGTSDARFIKDACPVIEFGLVGRTMHETDERVAVADLDRLTAIYGRVLDAYF